MRCMFCGHRNPWDLPCDIGEKIDAVVLRLIGEGVTEFWSGGMGAFDRMCESVVGRRKADYPAVRLCLVIPYISYTSSISRKYLAETYDEIIHPDLGKAYYKAAIPARNRYMADNCSVMLAFARFSTGGAASTLRYAETLPHMSIIRLA